MSKYKIKPLTQQSLSYIWNNLRDYDREELVLQGYDAKAVQRHLGHPFAFVGLEGGKPFVAFGATQYESCVFVWCFGTDRLDCNWKTVHSLATAFLSNLVSKYFGLSVCVQVWEGHTRSRAWLRRLGFRDTPHTTEINGEVLRVMEYRGRI